MAARAAALDVDPVEDTSDEFKGSNWPTGEGSKSCLFDAEKRVFFSPARDVEGRVKPETPAVREANRMQRFIMVVWLDSVL